MACLDIASKSASILLSTDGADDPDQLIGELAGWLQDADEHTRADFARCLGGYRTPDKTAWLATHIAERIAALLDGDRGQP
jgi:hypothetical protein